MSQPRTDGPANFTPPDKIRTVGMNDLAAREPIAIIGMAGRFPGAIDLDRLWSNLRGGMESAELPTPHVDGFDATLFDVTTEETGLADPQARLLLECAHAALEDARARWLTVVPQCPFIASYIRRHQEYVALVDPAYRERVAKDT